MSNRKYPSRSEKRKRKKEADEKNSALSGSIFKYHKSNMSTSKKLDELVLVLANGQTNANLEDDGHTPTEDYVDIDMDDTNVSDHEPMFNSFAIEFANVDDEPVIIMDI